MLPFDVVVTFCLASVVLAIAPGPDNIFVLTQSALHGKGAGLAVVLGLCTGLVFHSSAVALGVAVIFKTSVVAFTILKIVGALYLLYLAWMSFRASPEKIDQTTAIDLSMGKLYFRGIIMNITNPKVSIFFLAFLPQFTDPARGSVALQVILLGCLFILSTIWVFGGIALLAGALGRFLSRSEKAQSALNKIAGTVFVVLAAKLAMSHQ